MKHDWTVEDYAEYRREAMRRCQKARRERARAAGLCSICCRNPARDNMLTCYECSERAAKHNKGIREA